MKSEGRVLCNIPPHVGHSRLQGESSRPPELDHHVLRQRICLTSLVPTDEDLLPHSRAGTFLACSRLSRQVALSYRPPQECGRATMESPESHKGRGSLIRSVPIQRLAAR